MPYKCAVKQGNLLKEGNATFIVNASNTTLQLGSGVSASFRQRCGAKLQQEMLDKLALQDRSLQKGDVIATSSGDAMNFKYALHACVMDYSQGVRGEGKLPSLKNIKTILENIDAYLNWYADNHTNEAMKLVLPLMGCGVGGLDVREVLKIYKTHFSNEVSYPCEVVVYGYREENYLTIQEICQ